MVENKQGEQLITNWASAQEQLLTSWLDATRRAGASSSRTLWSQTLEAWYRSAQQTLDIQGQWMRSWVRSLSEAPGASTELRELLGQAEEQLKDWIQAQQQILQNWFALLKQITFTNEAGTGVSAGQQTIQAWQDMATKMIEAQTEWVRRWMAAFTISNRRPE